MEEKKSNIKQNLVLGKYSLQDLLNIDHLKALFQSFSEATGSSISLSSHPSGEVLFDIGWTEACGKFHRNNEQCLQQCKLSNIELVEDLGIRDKYRIAECKNGLMDFATPIVIKGIHIANILTGQVFFKAPDLEFFEKQAVKYGFDKAKYIEAILKVPIVDEKKSKNTLLFLSDLAISLAEQGLSKLQEKESIISYNNIRNQFELVTESSLDMIFIIDKNGIQKYLSKSLKDVLGYEVNDNIGTFFGDFVYENDLPEFINNIGLVYNGVEVKNFLAKIRHKEGHLVDVEINGKLVEVDGEQMALGSIRDVSKRKKAETDLINQETYNKALIEAIPDMIFVMDKKGICKDFIPASGLDTYVPKEFFIGKSLVEVMPKYVGGMTMLAIENLEKTQQTQSFSYYLEENGQKKYFESRFVSKSDEVIALVREITLQKQLEESLISSENRLRYLIDAMPDIVCFKDGQGRWLEANKYDLELFGLEGVDYKGKTDLELAEFSKFYNAAFMACKESDEIAWQKGSISRGEEIVITASGEEKVFDVMKVPSFDDKGNREGLLVVGRDITEKKKASKSLIESEALFRNLTESTSSGIVIYQGSQFVFANKAAEELTGFKREELVQIHFWDIFFDDDKKIVKERGLERMQGQGALEKYEFRIKKKNGDVIWVHYSANNTTWNGKPAVIGTAFDITRRKIAEINLAKREHYFHQIFEDNKIITLIINPEDGKIVSANTAAENFYGWTKTQLQTMNISQINTLPSKEIRKGIQDVLDQKIDHKEFVHRLSNGEERNVEAFPSIVEVDDQKLLYVIIVDVSDKHQAKNQLRLLGEALEQNSNTVVITNVNAEIEYVNSAFENLTGYTKEEAIGLNPSVLKSGKQSDCFYKEMWLKISSGNTWKGEFQNKKKNGSLFWESATISPISDSDDKITHYVAVKEDITGKRIMQEDLIKAKEKAEESDRLKTAFLQNMSHEIRTPLNGILGFAQLLTDPGIDLQSVQYYSNIISNSGNRLLDLINNVLDISKIESGDVRVVKEPIELNELLENVGDLITLKAKSKGVELNLQFELSNYESSIMMDAGKLNQILINLLNNALKFTKEGEIVCSYIIQDDEILFSIKDSGVGIMPEQQERIFDRFYQADNSINKAFEGAGLGLAITYSLVKLLGGNIWLESEVNVGTTFFFTIPYEPSRVHIHLSNEEPERLASRKLNILIAEDDDTSFLFLETILREYNVGISRVTNGLEAVEICKTEMFDVILMDINMPQMDGLEATKLIKRMNPKLPIIAQTAYAFTSEKNEAIQAGCDEYLSKPIVKLTLFKAIRDLVD